MGIVSILSIGANTYSVYALTADPLADTKAYLAGRLGTAAWDDANSNDKKKALVGSARFIDRAVSFSGTQTDIVTPQPLQWPRDGADCNGTSVTDGTTPDAFFEAQAEMALILLTDSTVQDGQGTGSNVKSVKAGSAKVDFFMSTLDSNQDTRLPPVVNDLLGCYIVGITTVGGSFGTGTDDADPGYNKCDFDRSQGFP